MQRTQRIATKLRELSANADLPTSTFMAAQVEDLERDLAQLIEDEMDRRIRVQQFTRRAAPTSGAGIEVIRSERPEPRPISGNWRGMRRTG